jgi:YVTN family beta-propeller protein
MNGRELFEIDPDSEKTRRVEIGAMPSGVAATPDGRLVIAAARDDNALVVIDAETFARVATIAVGRHPYGVTIDARGRRAYTANVESDDVSVIDLAERKLVASVPVGSHPYGVALAKGRAFVANQYAETVSVFDTATLAPLATIKVGEYPESVGVSRDGGTIYVTNWFSNDLWSIDAESYKITGKAATGDGPRAFGAFVRAVD